MCIFFNMYDTLEPLNIQRCQMEKWRKKIWTFLLYSYFFLYIWNLYKMNNVPNFWINAQKDEWICFFRWLLQTEQNTLKYASQQGKFFCIYCMSKKCFPFLYSDFLLKLQDNWDILYNAIYNIEILGQKKKTVHLP